MCVSTRSFHLLNNLPLRRFDVPSDCSVELSHSGNQFFTDIFEAYDRVRPFYCVVAPSYSYLTLKLVENRTKTGLSHNWSLMSCSQHRLEILGSRKVSRIPRLRMKWAKSLYRDGWRSGGECNEEVEWASMQLTSHAMWSA